MKKLLIVLFIASMAMNAWLVMNPLQPQPERAPTTMALSYEQNNPQLVRVAEMLGIRVQPGRSDADIAVDIKFRLGERIAAPDAVLPEDAFSRASSMLSDQEKHMLDDMQMFCKKVRGARLLALSEERRNR